MSGNVGLGAIYNGGLTSMHGSGLKDMIKNIHQMTKDKKVISGLLSKGAALAASKGYGKRRKRRRSRK